MVSSHGGQLWWRTCRKEEDSAHVRPDHLRSCACSSALTGVCLWNPAEAPPYSCSARWAEGGGQRTDHVGHQTNFLFLMKWDEREQKLARHIKGQLILKHLRSFRAINDRLLGNVLTLGVKFCPIWLWWLLAGFVTTAITWGDFMNSRVNESCVCSGFRFDDLVSKMKLRIFKASWFS